MQVLRDFRESIGKTQQEMAEELSISKSYYEKVESGERKLSRELIDRIKEKYPIIDLNIFFKQKTHKVCIENVQNDPESE